MSNRPLRVLFLAKGLGPGGMERLLVNHVAAGDTEHFDYSVAYLVERPGSVVPELEAAGAACVRLSSSSGDTRGWVSRLRRLVSALGVDVVHSHSPQPAALSRPVLRAMPGGPALVYTEHNTWDCYGPATRLANAATYQLDHAQFAVSNDARLSVPPLLRRRVEVLTHGIDLDGVRSALGNRGRVRTELGIGPDEVVVTNLAHLRREKAQHVLLEAAAGLVRDHPEVTVLSVGHGPLEEDLVAQRDSLELGDRFRFLGFRDDALDILAASDIFCLSSSQEGLPVAFMEASALGVPTVATRVGGLVDHVEEGVSGLLVEPGDPEVLREALARVVREPSLRVRMGEAARRGAAVFDSSEPVRHQERVYSRLRGLDLPVAEGGRPCAG